MLIICVLSSIRMNEKLCICFGVMFRSKKLVAGDHHHLHKWMQRLEWKDEVRSIDMIDWELSSLNCLSFHVVAFLLKHQLIVLYSVNRWTRSWTYWTVNDRQRCIALERRNHWNAFLHQFLTETTFLLRKMEMNTLEMIWFSFLHLLNIFKMVTKWLHLLKCTQRLAKKYSLISLKGCDDFRAITSHLSCDIPGNEAIACAHKRSYQCVS